MKEYSPWGYCDLVSLNSGEVFEVKRDTIYRTPSQIAKANAQLTKYYTLGHLHDKKFDKLPLNQGGSQGTKVLSGSFNFTDGIKDYSVTYWDNGGGIILYHYEEQVKWENVAVIRVIVVGGVAIGLTGGAATPAVVTAAGLLIA